MHALQTDGQIQTERHTHSARPADRRTDTDRETHSQRTPCRQIDGQIQTETLTAHALLADRWTDTDRDTHSQRTPCWQTDGHINAENPKYRKSGLTLYHVRLFTSCAAVQCANSSSVANQRASYSCCSSQACSPMFLRVFRFSSDKNADIRCSRQSTCSPEPRRWRSHRGRGRLRDGDRPRHRACPPRPSPPPRASSAVAHPYCSECSHSVTHNLVYTHSNPLHHRHHAPTHLTLQSIHTLYV